MALLKVAHLGNPILRKKSRFLKPEELADPKMQSFIDDMIETMREYDGVGLAAPQVHQSISMIVFEVAGNPRDPDSLHVPLTVLANVKITATTKEKEADWEGCLSVPDLRGKVSRPVGIEVEALDRHGTPVKFRAQGFHARVIQHENDHCEGKVFLDRMDNLSSLTFLREFERYHLARAEA
jgi:peptide deformylase